MYSCFFGGHPFLDFTNGEQALGNIVDFEGEEEVRTPRDGTFLYDRVVLELDGSMPAVGTRLQVFKLDPQAAVPSVELNDDKDYVPTSKSVIFGHHFTQYSSDTVVPRLGEIVAEMRLEDQRKDPQLAVSM